MPPKTRMCGGEGGGGGVEVALEEKVVEVVVDVIVDGVNSVNIETHVDVAMHEEPSLNTSAITFC